MRIGVTGVNVGPFAEGEHAARLAAAAEAAGIESLWTFEHVVVPAGYTSTYPYSKSGRMPGDGLAAIADPVTWLTFVGAHTSTLRLGTGIVILPQHNPVVFAKHVATADRLTGGRIELGIGIGWLEEEFAALGVPWERRTARTEEYVAAMRALWREDEATFDGEFVHLDRARCLPKPLQTGGVPIVVGGHTEGAARRAGRIGDGFYPATTPDRVAELVPVMRRAAEEAGRDPDTIEITAGAGVAVGREVVEAYAAAGVTRLVYVLTTYDPAALEEAFGTLVESVREAAGT